MKRIHCLPFLVLVLFLSGCDNAEIKESSPPKKTKSHLVESHLVSFAKKGIVQKRTGTLRARNEVKIHNQEEGKIVYLPFFESDEVKKGQIIAKLDDSLLQAQLLRVNANLRKAKSDLVRIKHLRKESFLSEEQLINVETELALAKADEAVLKTRLSYMTIKAPFSGVITQRLSETGNTAERFSHLLTLSDHSSMITQVSISEILLNHLNVGDEVKVQIDALGIQAYQGVVNRIHPSLNPITRQGTIEIRMDSVPPEAKPGQLCRVEIKTQIKNRLLIPLSALRRDKDGEFVYTINEQDKAIVTVIKTGLHIGEEITVLTGLEKGQRIITKGFLGLKPGDNVKSVNNKENFKTSGDKDNV